MWLGRWWRWNWWWCEGWGGQWKCLRLGGLRVLERVGFEEGGLVWDETVRVVVEEEGGWAMEVEEEDVEEEEAAGSGGKIVLESRDGVVV